MRFCFNSMKKVLAIFLITSIIGGSLHFDELAKVPHLKQHYYQHKMQHPADGVFDFMYKHYILNQKPESEKDKNEDSQLPFKSFQSYFSHFTPYTLEQRSLLLISETVNELKISFTELIITSCLFNIWQPPK